MDWLISQSVMNHQLTDHACLRWIWTTERGICMLCTRNTHGYFLVDYVRTGLSTGFENGVDSSPWGPLHVVVKRACFPASVPNVRPILAWHLLLVSSLPTCRRQTTKRTEQRAAAMMHQSFMTPQRTNYNNTITINFIYTTIIYHHIISQDVINYLVREPEERILSYSF